MRGRGGAGGCVISPEWNSWWSGEEGHRTTSGRLRHKQEGGCSPGLGLTSSHSEPPRGREEDDNLSPSMLLHRLPHCTGSKGVLGKAGLGWASIGRGASACVCVCAVPSTLRQIRRTIQWTVSHCERCCRAAPLISPHRAGVYFNARLFTALPFDLCGQGL